jgi:hypothetical protein
MFANISMLAETNTCGVPCEIPRVGEEIGEGIRGLEIASGVRSLSDSSKSVDRLISGSFPVPSPTRVTVNSDPIRPILVVDSLMIMSSMRKTKLNQSYFFRVWYVGGGVVLHCVVRSWCDYDDFNTSFICPY